MQMSCKSLSAVKGSEEGAVAGGGWGCNWPAEDRGLHAAEGLQYNGSIQRNVARSTVGSRQIRREKEIQIRAARLQVEKRC